MKVFPVRSRKTDKYMDYVYKSYAPAGPAAGKYASENFFIVSAGRDARLLDFADRLKEKQPSLINGVLGETVPMGLLHRVLQNLLRDGIAIRDLAQIMEALGDHATRTKDPITLTEFARKALVRTITEQHTDSEGKITAIVLEPALDPIPVKVLQGFLKTLQKQME